MHMRLQENNGRYKNVLKHKYSILIHILFLNKIKFIRNSNILLCA